MEGFRVQEFESSGFRDGTVQCSGHWGILGLPAAGVQGIGFFNFRRFGTWNNSIVIFQWLAPENHHYDNLYYSPFRTPPPHIYPLGCIPSVWQVRVWGLAFRV